MAIKDNVQFTYSPLIKPEAHIRLIQVAVESTKGPQIGHLRISILTPSSDHVLPYHAVSYDWGDSLDTDVITVINGAREEYMVVRKSCADVLRQISYFNSAKHYWIDAICINQNDNEEKSAQVSMMGRIFSGAENVLACIGMPRVDGQSLTYLLREFDEYLDTNGQSAGTFITETQEECSTGMLHLLQHSKSWLDQLTDEDTVRFSRLLDEIAGLQYFKRIWILQEIFLARHISIFYGFDELSLASLLFWWENLRPTHSCRNQDKSKPLLYNKLCLSRCGLAYIDSMRLVGGKFTEEFFTDGGGSRLGAVNDDFLRQCALSMKVHASNGPVCLRNLLDLCETRSCSDPRDMVYGTLALADWRNATVLGLGGKGVKPTDTMLRPDYTKSTLDLARDILPFLDTFHQITQIFNMLKLRLTGTMISPELAERQHVVPANPIRCGQSVVSWAQRSGQKHTHVAGGCVQISRNGAFTLKHCKGRNGRYCRILDSDATLCGFGSTSIRLGDWIFPTFSGFGFVLREVHPGSGFYAVVGRVTWMSDSILDEFQVTPFMLVIGTEDIVAQLRQSDEFWEDWSMRSGPQQALQAALNWPFCATPCSSFAVTPIGKYEVCYAAFKNHESVEAMTLDLLKDWRYRLLKVQGY